MAEVLLKRVSTAKVGDARRIFDFFTEEIDKAKKRQDEKLGMHVEEILELWEGMLIAQHAHDEALEDRISRLRSDCLAWTRQLVSLLAGISQHPDDADIPGSFLPSSSNGKANIEEEEEEDDEDDGEEDGSFDGENMMFVTPRRDTYAVHEDGDEPVTEFSSRKAKTSPRTEFSQRSSHRAVAFPGGSESALAECKRLCDELDKALSTDVLNVLSVPCNTISAGFTTKATVGLMLAGLYIDNMVVGGPAHNSQRLSKGDVLVRVDDVEVDCENLHDMLVGSDVPGSLVKISFLRPGSEEQHEVTLMRMATSTIADNVRMFEVFTALKDRSLRAGDRLGTTLLDEAIELWTGTLLSQGEHKNAVQDNVTSLHSTCREVLADLKLRLRRVLHGSPLDASATNGIENEFDECQLASFEASAANTGSFADWAQMGREAGGVGVPLSPAPASAGGRLTASKATLSDDLFMELLERDTLDDDVFVDLLQSEANDTLPIDTGHEHHDDHSAYT